MCRIHPATRDRFDLPFPLAAPPYRKRRISLRRRLLQQLPSPSGIWHVAREEIVSVSSNDGNGGVPPAYQDFDWNGIDRSGQAEAFDAIGDRYDEAFPHKEGQISAGAWLAGQLPAGSRILDLGCGTGLPTARQLTESRAPGHRNRSLARDAETGPRECSGGRLPPYGHLRRGKAGLWGLSTVSPLFSRC